MNLTITATSSGFGKTSQLGHAAATFVAAAGDTDLARRISGLLAELDDITRDRVMCARFVEPGLWLDDLRREERDVYEHLAEALSPDPA